MALAIIYTFHSIVYAITFALSIFSKSSFLETSIDWTDLGINSDEIIKMSNSFIFQAFILATVSVTLCIIMYIFNSKLEKESIVSKIPYIGIVINQLYFILDNLIFDKMNGLKLDFFSLLFNNGIALLAILSIINLSKIESQKKLS